MTDRAGALRDWLAKKPGDRFATYALALEVKKAGDLAEAERLLEALVLAHPHAGAGWYQLGVLHEEQGATEAAANAWRRGLAALRDADGPEERRSRGEIERALDSLDDGS